MNDDDNRLADLEQEKAASEFVPAIIDVRDSLDEINRTLKEIAKRLHTVSNCMGP